MAGIPWLGVAHIEEALALRAGGDEGRLLAWLITPGERLVEALAADVDLSVSSTWMLDEVVEAARATATTSRIHLKADTGLGRNGAAPADWPDLVTAALKAEAAGHVRVAGLWSHLACADEPGHRVAVIDHGRIIDIGSPASLIRRHCPERTVVVTTAHPAAEAIFAALPGVHVDRRDEAIAIRGRGDDLVTSVVQCIAREAILVSDLRTEAPTLEDVFLTLTGETVRA